MTVRFPRMFAAVLAVCLAAPLGRAAEADTSAPPPPSPSDKRLRPGGAPDRGRDGLDEPFLFSRLEKQLRRELTAEQKSEIRDAVETFLKEAQIIENNFAHKVADITGIPVEKVAALRPRLLSGSHARRVNPAALFIERLETLAKKSLTGSQQRQIQDAYERRENDLQDANDDLAKAIAEITRLSLAKVREAVPMAR